MIGFCITVLRVAPALARASLSVAVLEKEFGIETADTRMFSVYGAHYIYINQSVAASILLSTS